MTTIKIQKSALINAIANNCSAFGDYDAAIYVDKTGRVDFRNSSENNSDWMPVLTFSGMGDFIDENDNYANDDDYDAVGVAEYIVNDSECLQHSGSLSNDDGSESQYSFELV